MVVNYDGYGYNPDYVATESYGGQSQGYAQQMFKNQPHKPPFNSNQGQGNFNQGTTQTIILLMVIKRM